MPNIRRTGVVPTFAMSKASLFDIQLRLIVWVLDVNGLKPVFL